MADHPDGLMSPRMVKVAGDLMDALMELQPMIDSANPPKSISFVVMFHDKTRVPLRVLYRTEGSRDVTEHRRPTPIGRHFDR